MIPAGETCRIQSQEVSAMSRLPFESNTIPRGDRSCAAVAGPPSLSGPSARPSANCGPTRSTSEALKNYRAIRTQEGASPTTCNRELGYLRTAMRTAAFTTPPMLSMTNIPKFPIVSEYEFARQGFTEDADFEKVVTTLPAYLVPLATVAYNSGIRRGELMRIDWDQVDFDGGVIRLYRGRTKTGEPRLVPMIGSMEKVLREAKTQRDEFYPGCDRVFSRLGKPIKSFKNAWLAAVTRAGLPELQFHDFRRSAARNLSRSGVPERVIMAITGHKTRAMFDRYNIVSETDLTDAAPKINAYRAGKKGLGSELNSDKNRDSRISEDAKSAPSAGQ